MFARLDVVCIAMFAIFGCRVNSVVYDLLFLLLFYWLVALCWC